MRQTYKIFMFWFQLVRIYCLEGLKTEITAMVRLLL